MYNFSYKWLLSYVIVFYITNKILFKVREKELRVIVNNLIQFIYI